MFESMVNQKVKISYFSYRNDTKTERYLYGTLISEDSDFVQIEGKIDGKKFTINKAHIIEIVEMGDGE